MQPRITMALLTALLAVGLGAGAQGPLPETGSIADAAADGHMLEIKRLSERVFQLRVLELQTLTRVAGQDIAAQYTYVPVAMPDGGSRTCTALSPCGGEGLVLQRVLLTTQDLAPQSLDAAFVARVDLSPGAGAPVTAPYGGLYPDQTLETTGGVMTVTITHPAFDPTFQGVALGGASVPAGQGTHLVRGYYNHLKFTAPVDALDLVADVFRME